jgi:protein-S-isoprenylcysteine O-methyltransferase Ste14
MAQEHDIAGVAVRPPLLFVGALILGLALDRFLPLGPLAELFAQTSTAARLAVGFLLLLAGTGLMVSAMRGFGRAGTPVPTWQPTTALVTTGPYRFSRNPIYLALTLLYLGLCVVLSGGWSILLLIPVLIVLQFGVIRREELYLEHKFGEPYLAYKRQVRRWF